MIFAFHWNDGNLRKRSVRLADKLLLCAAVLYMFERGSIIIDEWNNIHCREGNIFVYVFLGLALIEYARLIWPHVKEWHTKRQKQYDLDVQDGQSAK